jgi:acyl-CoA dehydrogenase
MLVGSKEFHWSALLEGLPNSLPPQAFSNVRRLFATTICSRPSYGLGRLGGLTNVRDFAYTPAQQELKARAAAYAELLMGYEDEAEQAGGPLPKETVDKLTRAAMDAGVYGINMPVEWGGAGLTLLEQVIVEEEFGKLTNCLWDIPWRPSNVLALASPEQRERYLLPILRGERFDAFATTEPDAGSDAGAIATTATPVDGGWLINGEKWFVTCGDVADFLLVQANVLPGNESTLFFVEKDTEGVRISRTPQFMHSAVNGHPEFVFENVFVPTDAVLGEVGQASKSPRTGSPTSG